MIFSLFEIVEMMQSTASLRYFAMYLISLIFFSKRYFSFAELDLQIDVNSEYDNFTTDSFSFKYEM